MHKAFPMVITDIVIFGVQSICAGLILMRSIGSQPGKRNFKKRLTMLSLL